MADVDTRAIRAGLHRVCIDRHTYGGGEPCTTCGTILQLTDEITRLRALLTRVLRNES